MIDPRTPDFTDTPVSGRRAGFGYAAADVHAAPVVSIVTPFFNTREEFHETARSVFGQSLQQWEWIIVNDASADPAALNILDAYRTGDPRVRVIDHETNRGLSAARNTGVRAARSEYILLLDSDDLLEPTAAEKWFWHLATFPEHAFVKGFGIGFGAQEYLWQRGFHEREAFLEENLVDATSLVRRPVIESIGGFDESTRGGLEDWDLWLRAAAAGHWGATVPEYLNWYRRRAQHTDRWSNLGAEARAAFRTKLRARYPHLWEGGFPRDDQAPESAYAAMPDEYPANNILRKDGPRLLMILPWLALGGADKFNLDVIGQLRARGWDVTVATTVEGDHTWLPEFTRLTPDVFPLSHFLRPSDYPRFLAYLMTSRQVDTVMVSNAELGYRLLPYLRSRFPGVTFVDYCHMEEEAWNNGGYPRMAVQMQDVLDLNMVSSEYLRTWEIRRGGDPDRIAVCTTNIDCALWHPDAAVRSRERAAAGIPEDLTVLLYPGRIVEQKQPAVFIEALRLLHAAGARFLAVVAGDGPDRKALEQRAEQYGLNGVIRFLGAVPNDRVRALMRMSDILFLPSAWEGISLTVYEAMASGLAVVGAAVGGQAELVTEGSGLLIQRSDPATEARQYAGALHSLIADPASCARLKHAARARVEQQFSLACMGDRMVSLLAAAARLHRDNPRLPIAHGLGRSTALEALEMHRNPPRRWWYAGVTDSAGVLIGEVRAALAAGDRSGALALLRGLRGMFVRAEDTDRVAVVDRQIAEVTAMAAGQTGEGEAPADAPLISVLIPCRDQAAYVRETLESVVRQTETRWEIIVVDDGSTDGSPGVVRAFVAEHPGRRIRLIEQDHRGPSAARNAASRAAHGAFLLTLDADDRIAPAFMARCLAEFDRHPEAGFIYTHIRRFGIVNEVFELPAFDAHTVVHVDNTIPVCALIRRETWESAGGYDESMTDGYEDWDFWVSCIGKGWQGVRIPEPLFEYRIKGFGGLADANTRRMALIARIVRNHPALYPSSTQAWAESVLAGGALLHHGPQASLRIVYLIHSIQGVTGGNQTLLQQANALAERGHDVTIVTYTEPPSWITLTVRLIRVPETMPLSAGVPEADCVIATYFLNAFDLERCNVPVKVYFAQGDQYIFRDAAAAGGDGQDTRRMALSAASYRLPGVHVIANSATLQRAIRASGGQVLDATVPVCVDRAVFHPVEDGERGTVPRILVVGPDSAGTSTEPLTFKGIGDIREALGRLRREGEVFEVIRISNTPPEIFRNEPCAFHEAPPEAEKTRLFGTADILVYASHYDSCPRPPLEGMAAGLAVVCTATEGALEYCVEGENALLVPPADPSALASAIRSVLHDAGLRARLREGGLRTAGERPVEREWDAMAAVLAGLVPPENRRPSQQSHTEAHAGVIPVRVPASLTEGPAFARLINRILLAHPSGIICVEREDIAGAGDWMEPVAVHLQNRVSAGAAVPVLLDRTALPDGGDPAAYAVRTAGRVLPLSTIPVWAFALRSGTVATVGLLDETRTSIDAVLDDLALRLALAGYAIEQAGGCAVLLPAGSGQAVAGRRNRMIRVTGRRMATMEDAKREVLGLLDEARRLEADGRVEDAVALLTEGLERIPGSHGLHTARAFLLLRAGAFDRVSGLLEPTPDAVKRNPVWLEIAGIAMHGLGELALAQQCVDKALERDPGAAGAHLLQGMIAVDRGDAATARVAFERAIGADPASGLAHAHLGALLWATGEQEAARTALERAFVLSPVHPEILASYRSLVLEHGDVRAAAVAVADARMWHPEHRDLTVFHAECMEHMGDAAGALALILPLMGRRGLDEPLLAYARELRRQAGAPGPAGPGGISLCMIVRNEEANIARCLSGAFAFVDEIVVVDTGSDDRTKDVAAVCGAQVYDGTWTDDFAAARNIALDHATGGWVLALDADERLAPADAGMFRLLMDELRQAPAGVVFTTRNYVRDPGLQGWQPNDGLYTEQAGTGWLASDKVRLFPRRDGIRYEHPVHEIVEEALDRAGVPLRRTAIPIHHYGRLQEERTREKAERYAAIGRKKVRDSGHGDLRAVRELAAQEQELGNHAAAVPLWECIVQADGTDARAALGLGVSLAATGDRTAALPALAEAMRRDPALPEPPVKYGLVALECGDAAGAVRVLDDARRRHPSYPFVHAAYAAAAACAGLTAEAAGALDVLRRQGIAAGGFFHQVARDLMRAGQETYARSLSVCLQPTEGITVEP